jgi:hypothetical protein
VNPKLLFCGTEFGCFTTVDGGEKWFALRSGLPTIAIRDMQIQRSENDLVLGSFGRGFFILDDYSPLRDLKPEILDANHVFPIKKGEMYQVVSVMGVNGRGFQGANFYTAPNPEYGVTFTFHFKEELRSKKSQRERKDRELKSSGRDVNYPAWDALKAEDREVAPSRWLTIRDMEGKVVRKIQTTTGKGMTRANWDFRHAGSGGGGGRRRGGGGSSGPIAVPGKYTVEVSQMVDGAITEVVPKAEFEIEPITFGDTTEINRQAIMEFSKQAFKLANSVNAANQLATEASDRLAAMESLTATAAEVDPALWNEIRALQVRLQDIQEKFAGDPTRTKRNEDAMPGLQRRLSTAIMGAMSSTEGPTGTHRRQYEIAGEEFEAVLVELRKLLDEDMPSISKKFDELGAPWTPGRPIPAWK